MRDFLRESRTADPFDYSGYFYHSDHLGSSSWITDADKRAIQYLDYLPFGEPWVKERAVYSSWETPYTFSGKERDEETGYSYFGARYYDSDLSIWLSVDPLASKYPSVSPYVYCVNNPVKYWDPDGRWIPGLDNDGNVTYTAEKGDNHDTFVTQFLTGGKSREIFKNIGFGVNEGDINEGDVITGDAVRKATGSDILKGNWRGMTNDQKAAQIVFAINHSKSIGEFDFDLQDYAVGFQSRGRQELSNLNIPDGKGGKVPVLNISIGATWDNTRMTNGFKWNEDPRAAKETFSTLNVLSNGDTGQRVMIMFTIPSSSSSRFNKLFKRF